MRSNVFVAAAALLTGVLGSPARKEPSPTHQTAWRSWVEVPHGRYWQPTPAADGPYWESYPTPPAARGAPDIRRRQVPGVLPLKEAEKKEHLSRRGQPEVVYTTVTPASCFEMQPTSCPTKAPCSQPVPPPPAPPVQSPCSKPECSPPQSPPAPPAQSPCTKPECSPPQYTQAPPPPPQKPSPAPESPQPTPPKETPPPKPSKPAKCATCFSPKIWQTTEIMTPGQVTQVSDKTITTAIASTSTSVKASPPSPKEHTPAEPAPSKEQSPPSPAGQTGPTSQPTSMPEPATQPAAKSGPFSPTEIEQSVQPTPPGKEMSPSLAKGPSKTFSKETSSAKTELWSSIAASSSSAPVRMSTPVHSPHPSPTFLGGASEVCVPKVLALVVCLLGLLI